MNENETLPKNLDQVNFCFIIGMGRSGTTLLTTLLDQHQEIVAQPENNFVLFGKDLAKQNGSDLISKFHQLHKLKHNHSLSVWKPQLETLNFDKQHISYQDLCKLTYLSQYTEERRKSARIIIDKNPIYSLYISDLQKLFPKALFIVISRDPRDNYLSRRKHTSGIVSRWNTSLVNAWTMYYKSILKASDKNPNQFHFIKYEELASKPEIELAEIQAFLKLKQTNQISKPSIQNMANRLDQSNLNAMEKEKVLQMHHRLNQAVDTKKVAVWKKELTTLQAWYIYVLTRRTAKKMGYQIEKPNMPFFKLLILPIIVFQYPIHRITHWIFFYAYYNLSFELKRKIFK